MPDSAPRRTLGELTRQALAAAAARERNRLVEQLARITRPPEQITALADLLLAAGPPLPRAEMVKHLWHAHGLVLDGEKVHGLGRVTDPAELRARVAASDPPAEDVAPLRAAAEEHGAGLCPGCFAELPVPVEPLPPPLT